MNISYSAKDNITPDLMQKWRAAKNKTAIHQAIALGLMSITKRAFTDPSLRPQPWPALRGGGIATLRKSGTLAKSIRTVATARAATIASDRTYAAIHQLGGRTPAHVILPRNGRALKTPFGLFAKINHPGSNIPARPYMPFTPSGKPTAIATRTIVDILKVKLHIR